MSIYHSLMLLLVGIIVPISGAILKWMFRIEGKLDRFSGEYLTKDEYMKDQALRKETLDARLARGHTH